MGRFTDRIRKVLNPNKQKLIEFNREVGLNDDAKIIPMEQMQKPDDAYFIREVGTNRFLKFRNGDYFLEEKKEMSCLWDLQNGTAFLNSIETGHTTTELGAKPNLELVRLDQIIKK